MEILQEALSLSRLAGCSLEDETCYLFFNENPLGQPLALSYHPQAEISLWHWQAENGLWSELTNGEDSALPVLGCRLNQPELWGPALKKARHLESIQGPHPAAYAPRTGPQILLHLELAMLAIHADNMGICTPTQTLTLEQLTELLTLSKSQKLLEQRNYQEALETCQAVTQVWQGASDLHFTLAQCYLGLREWDRAIAEFQEVLRLQPQHGPAYFGLGEAHEGKGSPASFFFAQSVPLLAAQGKSEMAAEANRRAHR